MRLMQLTKDEKYFPKKNENHLFINPDAVMDVLLVKAKSGGRNAVESFLNEVTYNDGTTKLTKEIKDVFLSGLSKEISGTVDFTKADENSYSGEYDTRIPDGTYNTFKRFSQLWDMVTVRPMTTNRKSYILKYNLFLGGTVYDSIKGASHRTTSEIPNEVGELVTLSRFDQRFEIEIDDIIENLYQNDYESLTIQSHDIDYINEIDRVMVAGDADAGYAVTDDALGIMDGIEQILYTSDGIYTDRNSNEKDVLMLKHHLIPAMVDANVVNSTSVTSISALTGAQIFETLQHMLKKRNTDKDLRKGMPNSEIMFMVDYLTYQKYSEYRSATTSTGTHNTMRETMLQTGVAPLDHFGIPVKPLENMTGDFIVLGNPKNIYAVFSKSAEGSKMYKDYEPELSSGGSGYQYNRYLYAGLGIKNRGNFIISTAKASQEQVLKPEIVSSWSTRGTEVTDTTIDAVTTIYMYSNTKGAKLYYTTDGSTPDNTDTEIGRGTALTISNSTTVKVIAYDSEYLAKSDVAYVTRTDS